VYKEVLALSDAAVAKISGGAPPAEAPASGKKVLDVAKLVAELCVGVGTAFAPDAIKALESAAKQEAAGAPAKKAGKKATVKVRREGVSLPSQPTAALTSTPP
jgi:hypothetical protein